MGIRAIHHFAPLMLLLALLATEARAAAQSGDGVYTIDLQRLRGRALQARFASGDRPHHAVGLPLSRSGAEIVGIMGAAALIARPLVDSQWAARRLDGTGLDALVDLGDALGDGRSMGALTLGFFAAGRLRDDPRSRAVGADLTRSLLSTWTAVWILKIGVGARRPDGGPHSFPSGHTATAFAGAAVLQGHFGWKIGVPAYALAAATGLGRMEERRHHLADVLFGAGLGLALGREAVSGRLAGFGLEHLLLGSRRIGLQFDF